MKNIQGLFHVYINSPLCFVFSAITSNWLLDHLSCVSICTTWVSGYGTIWDTTVSFSLEALDLMNVTQCTRCQMLYVHFEPNPDSKVHGTNMGPIWGRQSAIQLVMADMILGKDYHLLSYCDIRIWYGDCNPCFQVCFPVIVVMDEERSCPDGVHSSGRGERKRDTI